MKYNLKTAVRVVREEDKPDLIPFFEAIKSDCNYQHFIGECSAIGQIYFIHPNGRLSLKGEIVNPNFNLSDYTILEGIPQNWREGMKPPYEKLIEETTEVEMLRTEVSMLESENKELRECLKKTYDVLRGFIPDFPFDNEDLDLKKEIEQLLK